VCDCARSRANELLRFASRRFLRFRFVLRERNAGEAGTKPDGRSSQPSLHRLDALRLTLFADGLTRPLFGGEEATSGFSGTFSDDAAEVFGTVPVSAYRSVGFRASLKQLAEL